MGRGSSQFMWNSTRENKVERICKVGGGICDAGWCAIDSALESKEKRDVGGEIDFE